MKFHEISSGSKKQANELNGRTPKRQRLTFTTQEEVSSKLGVPLARLHELELQGLEALYTEGYQSPNYEIGNLMKLLFGIRLQECQVSELSPVAPTQRENVGSHVRIRFNGSPEDICKVFLNLVRPKSPIGKTNYFDNPVEDIAHFIAKYFSFTSSKRYTIRQITNALKRLGFEEYEVEETNGKIENNVYDKLKWIGNNTSLYYIFKYMYVTPGNRESKKANVGILDSYKRVAMVIAESIDSSKKLPKSFSSIENELRQLDINKFSDSHKPNL